MTHKIIWPRPVVWLPILILFQLIITTVPTAAQTSSWVNTGGGSYTKASNWNPANVPDALGENAEFDLTDTYTVQILPSVSVEFDFLRIIEGNITFSAGNSLGDATLNASQGISLRQGNLTLARVGVSTDVHLSTDYEIKIEGGSTLAILDGAAVLADLLKVGLDNNNPGGANGSILVDGVGSTLTATSEVRLGALGPFGTGSLTIQNGASVSSLTGSIGFDSGSIGIATLDGAGSTWVASDSLYVGGSNASAGGTGTLTITDQGLLDVVDTLKIWNLGTVTLDGGSIVTNAFDNTDGGVFDFTAGSLTMNDSLVIGAGGLLGENRTLGFNQSVTTTGTTTVETGRLLTIDGGSLSTNNLIVNGGFHFDRGTLELTSGSITGISSLVVPANGEFRAQGMQTQRTTGTAGSTITATGNLSLGDAAMSNGFYTNGTLNVGANLVTIADANDAVFDSGAFVSFGEGVSPGELSTANGITLDFGGNFHGYGTVDTPNNAAKPLINNGNITGNSGVEPITLEGYVKGVGTMDNVVITGTDAPGFSPSAVNRGSVTYNGTLEIEIGGTTPGSSGHDQLNHVLGSGIAGLGGILDVSLIEGFVPSPGDTFEIITAASVIDTFETIHLPPLPGDLLWFVNYDFTSVNLVTTYAADFDEDGDVDFDDQGAWAGGYGSAPATHMTGDANADTFASGFDFLIWQRQQGIEGAAIAAASVVPEPSTLLLSTLGLLLLPARWKCAKQSGRAHKI